MKQKPAKGETVRRTGNNKCGVITDTQRSGDAAPRDWNVKVQFDDGHHYWGSWVDYERIDPQTQPA